MNVRGSLFRRHRPEALLSLTIIGCTLLIFYHGNIDDKFMLTIDILVACLGFSVAILKENYSEVAETLAERYRDIESKASRIATTLERLDGRDFEHASVIVDQALERLQSIPFGIIRLSENAYFTELFKSIESARVGSKVLAVSSMSISRWKEDQRQRHYLRLNLQAAERGVDIHRVFIVAKSEMESPISDKIRQIILEQRTAKINVDIVWREDISFNQELHDDFVLFDGAGTQCVFKDFPDSLFPERVQEGELISERKAIQKYVGTFDALRTFCIDAKTLERTLTV